jgi:putative hydrolase of the HAD superfamily
MRFAVVSNIRSEKSPWHRAFEAAGIDKLFEVFIWSSDGRAIKPAPEVFESAVAAIGAPRERIVFVGDDPKRDIEGAKGVGLAAIWIDDGGRQPPDVEPDLVVGSLIELAFTG